MSLMGRSFRLTAERAHQLGLVDELVPHDQLLSAATEMAQEMARNSPTAMALTQEAIWRSLETGHSQALEFGWALIRMHWSHPDFQEGPRAWVEKREPQWEVSPPPSVWDRHDGDG
jgi:E-phenylitaconyl-CoA hydratase